MIFLIFMIANVAFFVIGFYTAAVVALAMKREYEEIKKELESIGTTKTSDSR